MSTWMWKFQNQKGTVQNYFNFPVNKLNKVKQLEYIKHLITISLKIFEQRFIAPRESLRKRFITTPIYLRNKTATAELSNCLY